MRTEVVLIFTSSLTHRCILEISLIRKPSHGISGVVPAQWKLGQALTRCRYSRDAAKDCETHTVPHDAQAPLW